MTAILLNVFNKLTRSADPTNSLVARTAPPLAAAVLFSNVTLDNFSTLESSEIAPPLPDALLSMNAVS